MKNFLMFDTMITPWIIRILYWILQLVIIIVSLGSLIGEFRFSGVGLFDFLLVIILGTLILRLVFEMLMVQFKISENTSQLKSLLNQKHTTSAYTSAISSSEQIFCGHCGEKQTKSSENEFCDKCNKKL